MSILSQTKSIPLVAAGAAVIYLPDERLVRCARCGREHDVKSSPTLSLDGFLVYHASCAPGEPS